MSDYEHRLEALERRVARLVDRCEQVVDVIEKRYAQPAKPTPKPTVEPLDGQLPLPDEYLPTPINPPCECGHYHTDHLGWWQAGCTKCFNKDCGCEQFVELAPQPKP